MSAKASFASRPKAEALNESQRRRLTKLILSKKEISNPATDYRSINKRQDAWEEVAFEFNLPFPAAQHRTVLQLKRVWEYIRKL